MYGGSDGTAGVPLVDVGCVIGSDCVVDADCAHADVAKTTLVNQIKRFRIYLLPGALRLLSFQSYS